MNSHSGVHDHWPQSTRFHHQPTIHRGSAIRVRWTTTTTNNGHHNRLGLAHALARSLFHRRAPQWPVDND